MGERENSGTPINGTSIGTETLLREEMDTLVRGLDARFEGFAQTVLTRLDDDSPAEPERVLRVDEALPEERADAAMIDDEAFELLGPALREANERELADLDWARFMTDVDDAIDGEALAPAVAAALKVEAAQEASELDWAAFAGGIDDAIDGEALAPAVGAALKVETEREASELDWAAFAGGIDDAIDGEALAPAVAAALKVETEREASELDWAAFAGGIDDAIDGEALAPAVGAALRESVLEAVAAREGDWASFSDGVLAKLPVETVTVAELLTEATEAELAARDGEWNAFTARVFEAVDAEVLAAARAPLESQAVMQLKAEVDAEVEQMAPQFGEAFKKDVERQIFKSGQHTETPWWTRAWTWLREEFSFEGGYGLAAAAATAVLLVAVTGLPPAENLGGSASAALSGQVAVEQLNFEGDVTVMPEEGLTIVWLDAPS